VHPPSRKAYLPRDMVAEPLNDPFLEQEIALLSDVMLAATASSSHLKDEQVDAVLGLTCSTEPHDTLAQGDERAERKGSVSAAEAD
jgi:hypothetical protein